MSLNADFTKLAHTDYKDSDAGWAIAQAVIFSCLHTGIGALTEKNFKTAYGRYVLFYRVVGLEPGLTLEHFRRYVGLSTNVFPEKTDAQWARGLATIARDEVLTVIRRAEYVETNGEGA